MATMREIILTLREQAEETRYDKSYATHYPTAHATINKLHTLGKISKYTTNKTKSKFFITLNNDRVVVIKYHKHNKHGFNYSFNYTLYRLDKTIHLHGKIENADHIIYTIFCLSGARVDTRAN